MLVTLIGKDSMYKILLPQNAIGNYWISGENDRKLVNIEGQEGKWQITSNKNVKVLKEQNGSKQEVNRIMLKEYSMHYVYLEKYNSVFVLYCSPVYENNFLQLDINTSEILIGNGQQNHISYNNPLVESKHARIFLNNGRWMLENFDLKYGTFINSKSVSSNIEFLFNGDVIFVMGLKIIMMGKSIVINNPLGMVAYNRKNFIENKTPNNFSNLKKEDDTDTELYTEKDYFSRAPRITNIIESEKVKIDAPPIQQNKDETPLIYILGPMLSMGAMMMMSVVSSINGIASGQASTSETTFALIMAAAMLFSMILLPILNVRYEKNKKLKHEEKRQKKYKEYIDSKAASIDEIMKKQRGILFKNYASAEGCVKIILEKNVRLWERKIEEYDFLTLRLGIGEAPLNIDIQYPEEQFVLDEDNLVAILNSITNKSKILKDVPITISLVEKNVSALIVKDNQKIIEKFMQNLILQLVTFHSYEDLKLVFLFKKDEQKKWDYVKMLPHIWNNTKQIRFFADDYDDMKEISRYLEEELQNRMMSENELDYKTFTPYYLIITDDYKKVENLKIITQILKTKINVGFSILCISNNLMQLPNECKTFINLDNNVGTIFESEISSTNQRQFTFDGSQTIFFDKICQTISNIPIKYAASGRMLLPNNYTFLEMYDVGRIEQLNILERWNSNDSTLSLKAPIGVDSTGMPIVLDIHEKFHGPHGLIAGSTGSGKSEFIITYILSLALNYHPDDVTFILIDYKGGGLAGAFQKRDIKLPHLVGTITNIDKVGLQRSLASIQSEMKRRQVMFNKARNAIDEGTIDIYKYQKLYHEGVVDEPIPHLLIICDEFAELKQQQEDFMDELISVARIGRSLGVHLILATQKPAGIVNDQIRSNSKFGICLKVQDREDSNDVIRRPDAAFLKKAGQFYLQVGNDEYFTLGQSGWSGAPYYPLDIVKKKVDTSIELISNIGTVIKEVDNGTKEEVNSSGEQLTNIVKYMHELAQQEDIEADPLWLENIPETIFLKEIRKKYNAKNQKNIINPVIGEYDDPSNQRQGIVNLDLSNQGNTIIFGNADSGKETLLSTICYDLITSYTSSEVQLYLLDFGSEVLKIFKKAPHVGDVVYINNTEKLSRFFDMIQKEIKDRKEILSDYNGDYNLYLNTSGKPMPMIVVMLNNFEAFFENYENDYDDIFLTLTRECIKYGIVFIITASAPNDIRYRLAQNFKQKIALQLNNEDEYMSIFDRVDKKRPSRIFGRGLVNLDDIYEFQTAKICPAGEWNGHIKEIIEKLKEKNEVVAKHIPTLPDKVTLEDVKESIGNISSVPIGIIKKTLNVFTYDFVKNFITIITAKNIEHVIQFTAHILEVAKQIKEVEIIVFDAERILQTKKSNLKTTYNDFVKEMKSSGNKKGSKHSLCIIIGIDKLLNDLGEDEYEFANTLKQAEESENYSFIFVENATRLKNHEYDEWYKNYISGDSGTWVGKGVNDQYVINLNQMAKEEMNNCENSFGVVIKQGEPTLIKLLGMKDKGDENE